MDYLKKIKHNEKKMSPEAKNVKLLDLVKVYFCKNCLLFNKNL